MFSIMMKDLDREKWLLTAYAAMIAALSVLALLTKGWIFFTAAAPLLVAMPLASALTAEKAEDRYSGYMFLRSLPVGTARIVGAKYIIQFAVLGAAALLSTGMVFLVTVDPVLAKSGAVIVAWSAGISMVCISLSFIGTYALGMTRFTTVLKITVLTTILIPQFLLYYARKADMSIDFDKILRGIGQSNPIVPLAVFAALSGTGYFVSVFIKNRK